MPETARIQIALEPARQPEVIALVDELDAYQSVLYPPESHHGIDMDALSQPNVLFAVLRGEEGAAVGCGAIVVGKEYGEIKRMFVRPHFRGRGAAKALLVFLEGEAARLGCTLLMLETGISQPEALALYARCGYARRGPFGDYWNDPLSVFMSKQIGGDAS
jgi:putative acetyltransferase